MVVGLWFLALLTVSTLRSTTALLVSLSNELLSASIDASGGESFSVASICGSAQ
jgi:hypothetical protein